MRQLLLLRHAKSSWDDPALTDHARPLNARGREAAAAMRQAMQELGLAPDLVLVSSAKRTLETLERLEPWDETPLTETRDALYLAAAGQLLGILRDTPETVRSVMMIGHNPGLHELALFLAANGNRAKRSVLQRLSAAFPTAALAEFSVAGPWRELGRGGGDLTRFLTPRDLRRG